MGRYRAVSTLMAVALLCFQNGSDSLASTESAQLAQGDEYLGLSLCGASCSSASALVSRSILREGYCERLFLEVASDAASKGGRTMLSAALLDSGTQRQFALIEQGESCEDKEQSGGFFSPRIDPGAAISKARSFLAAISNWRSPHGAKTRAIDVHSAQPELLGCIRDSRNLGVVSLSQLPVESGIEFLVPFSECRAPSGLFAAAHVVYVFSTDSFEIEIIRHLGVSL